MTKLKCWKKIELVAGRGVLKGEYAVEITRKTGLLDIQTFFDKKSAEKFKNKYMKEHDKC